MVEFLLGMDFELIGDVHVLGALEDLRIDNVGDDGLVFAREIFVQQLDQFFA